MYLLTEPLTDADLISTTAILAGFGITVFTFRLQREVGILDEELEKDAQQRETQKVEANAEEKPKKKSPAHIPWADRLIFFSVIASLFCLATLLALHDRFNTMVWVPALTVGSAFLQLGYMPSVLAHYGIWIGGPPKRKMEREAGEPTERLIVFATVIVASAAFLWVLLAGIC